MSIYNGLIGLGFKNITDFYLRDDGAGVYIEEWFSAETQPSNSDIESGEQKFNAQQEAKAQLRSSVINKIATNLTSEEKLWLEENL